MAGAIDVIFNLITQGTTFFLYGWPFMLLFMIIILKFKWKNWPIEAVIIEKRGFNLLKTNDRCGRYVDPYTQIIGYKLQKAKDLLPVVNYDWVLVNAQVHNTFLERFIHLLRGNVGTIFLFKYGSKQYKPIHIKMKDGVKTILKELKNPDGSSMLIRMYEQFDPRKHLGALDFEVIDWDNMNFMIQEQRATFERRRNKKQFLYQILIPITMMVIAALVCIIMFKFSYDYAVAMRGGTQIVPETPAEAPKVPIVSDLLPPAS